MFKSPQLDPIRDKVALALTGPTPMALLIINSRPDEQERTALIAWADARQRCAVIARRFFAALPLPPSMDEGLKERVREGLAAFINQGQRLSNSLTAALYNGQLTFAEFNQKRENTHEKLLAALHSWLAVLDAEDQAETLQRAEAAQQRADAAVGLITAVACAAGSRSHFVQAMCH